MLTIFRFIFICFALLCGAQSYANVTIPAFTTQSIIDTSNTLSQSQINALQQSIDQIEQKANDGTQIAVLILSSLEGNDIESVAVHTFEKWRLGQKSKDNGVLFVIAIQEKRVRIEVGYGLEGFIPDVVAGRIIRASIAPAFKQNDYFTGIQSALNDIAAHLPKPGEKAPDNTNYERSDYFAQTVFFSLFASAFFSPYTVRTKKYQIPLNSGLAFIGTQALTLTTYGAFIKEHLALLLLSLPLSIVICTLLSAFILTAKGQKMMRSVSRGSRYSGSGGGFGNRRGGSRGRNGGGGGRSGGGGASGGW